VKTPARQKKCLTVFRKTEEESGGQVDARGKEVESGAAGLTEIKGGEMDSNVGSFGIGSKQK